MAKELYCMGTISLHCICVGETPYTQDTVYVLCFAVDFTSRWPFAKLKTTKIRFSKSGNKAHIPIRENKNHDNFVKPTFACFREIKYPQNTCIRRIRY